VLTFAVVIVVLCVAAIVLSAPLILHRLEPYRPATGPSGLGDEEQSSEAGRLLEALSELEHSRQSGKVTPTDYAAQRDRLEREYLRVAGSGGDVP
jgi:hypothetical protein